MVDFRCDATGGWGRGEAVLQDNDRQHASASMHCVEDCLQHERKGSIGVDAQQKRIQPLLKQPMPPVLAPAHHQSCPVVPAITPSKAVAWRHLPRCFAPTHRRIRRTRTREYAIDSEQCSAPNVTLAIVVQRTPTNRLLTGNVDRNIVVHTSLLKALRMQSRSPSISAGSAT